MKLTSDRRNFFLGFLALVSLAFLAILVPFYSALMWAVILAMLFAPMQRALMRRMPQRPNTATFITLGAVIMMVIIPVIGLTMSLVNQGAGCPGAAGPAVHPAETGRQWQRDRPVPGLAGRQHRPEHGGCPGQYWRAAVRAVLPAA